MWKRQSSKGQNWSKFGNKVRGCIFAFKFETISNSLHSSQLFKRLKSFHQRRAFQAFKDVLAYRLEEDGARLKSYVIMEGVFLKKLRKKLASSFSRWRDFVLFDRHVEAKYELALKMLTNREARIRLQKLSCAWRQWEKDKITLLESAEDNLQTNMRCLKTSIDEYKKSKALTYLDTLLKGYERNGMERGEHCTPCDSQATRNPLILVVPPSLVAGFRLWLTFSKWNKVLQERRMLKLGSLGKWRHRRGMAWSFLAWRRESSRRAEAGKLIMRVVARQAKEEVRNGWAAFIENMVLKKRTNVLREKGCKDLVRIEMSRGKDEVKSKFYTWTRFVSSSKIKDLEDGSVQDGLRLAASKIKMEFMRGVVGKLAQAWRKWKDTILYDKGESDQNLRAALLVLFVLSLHAQMPF